MSYINENLRIEIRPIPNRGEIRKFSENLEYFSQSHILGCFVNPVSLRYETGLSKEDLEYLEEVRCPYDVTDIYTNNVPHIFWDNQMSKIALTNSPIFLYPGKSILDFIKWKYLLASRYIYNSEAEMLTGVKPEATHFIYNEDEETAIKATKVQLKNDMIVKLSKQSPERKRELILIITDEVTENKDDDYLTVKLEEMINNKAQFLRLTELINANKDEVKMLATIKLAINKKVLTRTQKGIYFYENNIGFTEKDVMQFLLNTENQEILLNIKSKI